MFALLIFLYFLNFFLSWYSINNGRYKVGDLYLSKEESKDIVEFLAKKRNTKNYKSKSRDRLYKIFKKQSKNKKE